MKARMSFLKRKGESAFLITPIGWLLILVTVFVAFAAFNTGNNLIYLLDSILIAALITCAVKTYFALNGLSVERVVLAEVFAGKRCSVDIVVRKLPKKGEACYGIEILDEIEGETGRRFIPEIAAGETVVATYSFVPERRGILKVGPMQLRSRFPVGFFERRVTVGKVQEVIVFPRMGRIVGRVEKLSGGEVEAGSSAVGERRKGGSDEFYGLREYRPGDNPHHIYWRSTARYPHLLLKEFERDEPRRVVVFLDTFAHNDEGLNRLEKAISFTATVIDSMIRLGWGITLVLFSNAPSIIRCEHGQGIPRRMLKALALLNPSTESAAVQAGKVATACREGRSLFVVLGRESPLLRMVAQGEKGAVVNVASAEFDRLFRLGD